MYSRLFIFSRDKFPQYDTTIQSIFIHPPAKSYVCYIRCVVIPRYPVTSGFSIYRRTVFGHAVTLYRRYACWDSSEGGYE